MDAATSEDTDCRHANNMLEEQLITMACHDFHTIADIQLLFLENLHILPFLLFSYFLQPHINKSDAIF